MYMVLQPRCLTQVGGGEGWRAPWRRVGFCACVRAGGHAPGLFRLWGVFLGARGRDPIGSELRMSFPSHRFRVVQPSASWLKLLISPTNVYYPFYLMHYYVLILHETERKRLSDSLAPKGRFLYIVPAFHCFLLLLLSF